MICPAREVLTMYTLITPPLTLENSALFTPKASKLKPDQPSYYARLLATAAAAQSDAWRELEAALDELGRSHFGSDYTAMVRSSSFRSPIRRDVTGKGWPSDIVAFLNVKRGADYKPVVVGRDALPVMDPAELYPGCTVRASLRIYAYGGKGMPYTPGISFGLNNIQKLGDGPRLSTARGDGSEFGALSAELEEILR